MSREHELKTVNLGSDGGNSEKAAVNDGDWQDTTDEDDRSEYAVAL